MVSDEGIRFAATLAVVLRRLKDAGQSDEGVLLDADEVKTLITAFKAMATKRPVN